MGAEIGGGSSRRQSSLAAINVTPLVDVMLVLLIIFMVTAPMLQQGVDVALPEVEQTKGLPQAKEPIVITIQKNGRVQIDNVTIKNLRKLAPVLQEVLKKRSKDEVFLQADKRVSYGRVAQVMAAVQAAGVDKMSMVTIEPQ